MPFDEEELDPHGECAARIHKLEKALTDIAQGNCPGKLIDATENVTSQAEAQRVFHMGFSAWMQQTARTALEH